MIQSKTILPGLIVSLLASGCSILMEPDETKPSTKGSGAGTGNSAGSGADRNGVGGDAAGGVAAGAGTGLGGADAGSSGQATLGGTGQFAGGASTGGASGVSGSAAVGGSAFGGTAGIGGLALSGATSGGAALGGAPSGGTTGGGGTASGGAPIGGSNAGGTGVGGGGSCTNEGCSCTGTATLACNDCGVRACNPTTHVWGACAAAATPATQCATVSTLQTCGSDGKWTTTPCTNPDAVHCMAKCVAVASVASCVVAAADADGDGYGSSACAPRPGTDCDDAVPAVHPGAPEICDGIDNDCNGKADLNDGLALGGTGQLQSGHSAIAMAWSPTTLQFALVAERHDSTMTNGAISFGSLQPNGTAGWSGVALDEGVASFYWPQVLWFPGAGKFAYSYSVGGRAGAYSHVRLVTDQGVGDMGDGFLGPLNSTSVQGTAMALRASGDVLITYHDLTNTYVSRYTATTLDTSVTLTGESSIMPRIATSGDSSVVVYQVVNTNTINSVRINASLVAGAPSPVTSAGGWPDITSIANGYAMAWTTATGFDYQLVSSADGTVVCGPTHVPFGNGTLEPEDGVALKATQYGVLALVTDLGSKQVRLFRFGGGCNVTDQVTVRDAVTGCTHPAIAVGGGYVALSWAEAAALASDGYLRVLGERLCN